MFAASKGDLEMMTLLMDYGAIVDRQDAEGFTALHHAILRDKHIQLLC